MSAVLAGAVACCAICAAQSPGEPQRKVAAASSSQPRRVPTAAAPATPQTTAPLERTWGYLDTYPGLRVSIGPLWSLAHEPPVTYFALDVTASALVVFSLNRVGSQVRRQRFIETLLLVPELGYSYDGRGLHLSSLGLAFGVQTSAILGLLYAPRAVLGSGGDGLAYGVRHGLQLQLALVLTLELAHQVVWSGGDDQHDLRLVLGFDLVRGLSVLVKALKR